jgi:hypothetical protein
MNSNYVSFILLSLSFASDEQDGQFPYQWTTFQTPPFSHFLQTLVPTLDKIQKLKWQKTHFYPITFSNDQFNP